MLHTRAQVALRRGTDPTAEALREVFQELLADEQPLRRMGALVAGVDIRYPMSGPYGHHPLAGTFAPDLTLHTDRGVTGLGELLHTARPLLLDLAEREDLRRAAGDWTPDRPDDPDHPDRIRLQGTYMRTPVIDAFDAVLTTPASTVTTDLRT